MHTQTTNTPTPTRVELMNTAQSHQRAPMPAGFTRQQVRRLVAHMIG